MECDRDLCPGESRNPIFLLPVLLDQAEWHYLVRLVLLLRIGDVDIFYHWIYYGLTTALRAMWV